jgi:RimJ/RimL family protein N-acetyltransferase
VGEVGFRRFEVETGFAMFNLKIARSERGKGYARAAMRIFLHAFFNKFGGRIILDDISLDNQ